MTSESDADAAPGARSDAAAGVAADRPAPTDRLLLVLQVLALISLAVVALEPLSTAPALTAMIGAALVVIAGAWTARALTRSPRVRAVLAVLVLAVAVPLTLFGTLGMVYPVLLLALALLVLDVSRRAGAIGWAVMALTAPVILLALDSAPGEVAISLVGLGALEGVGFALGILWRGYEDRRETDRRLLAERDEALARLETAMVRVRRAAESEKELVLADERTRAARDLHDGLGHRLTLVSMSLEFAERMRERDADAAWAEVSTAHATAVEAMGEMRTWVRALSPVRDPAATGAAAFDAIAESFRGTGLDVRVSHDGLRDLELGEDVSLLLYRAVQEGLTNALRHGRARSVGIDLGIENGNVRLLLTSDLDAAARATVPAGPLEPGFGLRGLAERADALGGSSSARRDADEVVLRVSVPARAPRLATSTDGAVR